MSGEILHGTNYGYRFHGCRCGQCVEAYQNYEREYRERPDVKARKRARSQTPESRAQRVAYNHRPDVQTRRRERQRRKRAAERGAR